MRIPEYPTRRIEKPEKIKQDPDVPIIDIVRHGQSVYKQRTYKGISEEIRNRPLDTSAPDFALDSEHLDLTPGGILTIQATAKQLAGIIKRSEKTNKRREVVLIVSSPQWRAHSSALILDKELRDRGIEILNDEGIFHLMSAVSDTSATEKRIQTRSKEQKLPLENTSLIQEQNFERFLRHMNNISQFLQPETKAKIGRKKLRIVCLTHEEAAMDFLGKAVGTDEPEEGWPHPIATGQIVEITPQSKLAPEREARTHVTLYPNVYEKTKKEADIVRGFKPPKTAQDEVPVESEKISTPVPQQRQRVETPEMKTDFALEKWGYDERSMERFLANVPEWNRNVFKNALVEGGGKAFGLRVCEYLAMHYRKNAVRNLLGASEYIAIPHWRIVSDPQTIAARENENKILRSSHPNEDWLDPRSGTERSFKFEKGLDDDSALFESLKRKNELPASPFILQEIVKGYGVVLDIAFSSIYGKVVAKMSYGNARMAGYTLTSATYDTESGVAIWDAETGASLVPARNQYYPSMLHPGDHNSNAFLKELFRAIKEIRINFGVQMEIIMEPSRVIRNLVQLRPTPENIQRRIPVAPSAPQHIRRTDALVAESPLVNGVFDFTGPVELFDDEGLEKNHERGENQKVMRRSGSGRVGIYNRPIARQNIGIRLDHIRSPAIYLGGYLRGAEVQITSQPIRPNSHHGTISMPGEENVERYNLLDTHCGMVSIQRNEMQEIEQAIKSADKPLRMRVVSDGLVARIYLLRDSP